MSTLHRNAEISTREDKKPSMILEYNATKGGVDNLDKVTGSYSTKRMTARWPLVIFYNIIDVSACNAFVIWTEILPEWNMSKLYKRRIFLEELGKSLVVPHIQRRQHMPRTPVTAAIVRERSAPSTPVSEVIECVLSFFISLTLLTLVLPRLVLEHFLSLSYPTRIIPPVLSPSLICSLNIDLCRQAVGGTDRGRIQRSFYKCGC